MQTLSIFPEPEQRRIAVDFLLLQGDGQVGQLRVPIAVKRAVEGAEKSEAALRSYLDKQVESGVITPAKRKVLGM